MKFMKLGTLPDTFFTVEATRTMISDVQSDLTIQINNVSYLLHKCSLLPKCGLLPRLLSEREHSSNIALDLHDIPGGEEAFELCAKFCYGITIKLSAQNFVPAFCAAKFLRMTEAVENGNFIMKLEAFFSSCILEGWKDSVVTLQSTERVYEWPENLGIVRRCIESIVDKILTPPAKVTWSYTYTRPGYDKKRHQSVPKDWWTEDISLLDIDMFRSIVTAIKSTNMLQPQLIGEALHVYACRWLLDVAESGPNKSSASHIEDFPNTNRKHRILETIVNLIPPDKGSVSVRFLLRLLSIANFLGGSAVTKAELGRLSGLQLDEATLNDLLLPTRSPKNQTSYDIDLVRTVLESYWRQWKRQAPLGESQSLRSIRKVGKLIDSYLLVAAKDANMPVQKVVSLIETLPGIARPEQNDLYKAINMYLKEHPDLSKTEKKQLCRFLDCQKLSSQVRAHAVRNERLPLRTVVQVLFFEQEKSNTTTNIRHESSEQLEARQQTSVIREGLSKLKVSSDEQSRKAKGNSLSAPGTSGFHQNLSKSDDKPQLKPEPSFKIREVTGAETGKGQEIRDEKTSGVQLKNEVRRASDKTHSKVRER